MKRSPVILLIIIIVTGFGHARVIQVAINSINVQIVYPTPRDVPKLVLGYQAGINPVNFDEVFGLEFGVHYFRYREYHDVIVKAYFKQEFPLKGISPYLGAGLGHRWNWLEEGR